MSDADQEREDRLYDLIRSKWTESHPGNSRENLAQDATLAILAAGYRLPGDVTRAEALIATIRGILARSGTDMNSTNRVLDAIDEYERGE